LTALPNTAVTTNASLLTSGSGTDQLSVSSGKVLLQATQTGVTIPTVTTLTNGVTVTTNSDKTGYSLTQSFPTNFASTSIDSSGRVLLQPTQTGVTIPTVTTVTNQVTAAVLASAVWKDTTAGDFSVAGSIGLSLAPATLGTAPGASGGLFIAGSNAATTVNFTGNLSGSVGSVTGTVGSVSGVTFPSGFSSLTTTAIATAVLTDTGDNATAGSPGKILAQLGSAFTTTSSSVFSTASLVNAPTGGSAPTAAQIATAVWTDTTSGDFTTSGSPGKLLVNTGVTVATNNDKTGYILASNGVDSVVAETGVNLRQAVALTMDASLGVLTGATTSTITVKDPTGTYTRAVVAVDGNGNRTSDTLTPPA